MTSIIMNIIKKYQKAVEDQESWRISSSESAISDAKKFDLIAHHFISIISLMCIGRSKVTSITAEKL